MYTKMQSRTDAFATSPAQVQDPRVRHFPLVQKSLFLSEEGIKTLISDERFILLEYKESVEGFESAYPCRFEKVLSCFKAFSRSLYQSGIGSCC